MIHDKNNKILTGKLKRISKLLSKFYSVKIGLLAGKGGDTPVSENMDLAGIGAVQEFGADIKITPKMAAYLGIKAKELGLPPKQTKGDGYVHIPARSWLYEPIKSPEFRKMAYEAVGDLELMEMFAEEYQDKDVIKDIANSIGEAALLQINKAFANGGINGEWQPNSPFTVAQKGSSKPLIADGNLRGHITFEVEENA